MKSEVAFFKRRITANDIIKTFRFAGFTDDEIVTEIKKWKKFTEENKMSDTAYTDSLEYLKGCYDKPLESESSVTQNVCSWIQENDPEINLWSTTCHNTFYLDADKPSDNHMKYCCYCGKKIKEEA